MGSELHIITNDNAAPLPIQIRKPQHQLYIRMCQFIAESCTGMGSVLHYPLLIHMSRIHAGDGKFWEHDNWSGSFWPFVGLHFNIVTTPSHHWILCHTSWGSTKITSTFFTQIIFNISLPSLQSLLGSLFPSVSAIKIMYTFLFPIISCLYHPPWFEYLKNVWYGVQIMKPAFVRIILHTFCTLSFLTTKCQSFSTSRRNVPSVQTWLQAWLRSCNSTRNMSYLSGNTIIQVCFPMRNTQLQVMGISCFYLPYQVCRNTQLNRAFFHYLLGYNAQIRTHIR